jgi:cell wall-associated NlpC family hydrolase
MTLSHCALPHSAAPSAAPATDTAVPSRHCDRLPSAPAGRLLPGARLTRTTAATVAAAAAALLTWWTAPTATPAPLGPAAPARPAAPAHRPARQVAGGPAVPIMVAAMVSNVPGAGLTSARPAVVTPAVTGVARIRTLMLTATAPRPAVAKPAAVKPAAITIPGPPRPTVGTTALAAALGERGVPYVWGGTTPRGFDCSGLTQWSYRRAGRSLPRTSSAQSQVGTPVSRADLRPGDLVFFYTPVSHVAIYVGNGQVVQASEPGQPVKISPISHMPFHNARRL